MSHKQFYRYFSNSACYIFSKPCIPTPIVKSLLTNEITVLCKAIHVLFHLPYEECHRFHWGWIWGTYTQKSWVSILLSSATFYLPSVFAQRKVYKETVELLACMVAYTEYRHFLQYFQELLAIPSWYFLRIVMKMITLLCTCLSQTLFSGNHYLP
jgi:hypothetical protein